MAMVNEKYDQIADQLLLLDDENNIHVLEHSLYSNDQRNVVYYVLPSQNENEHCNSFMQHNSSSMNSSCASFGGAAIIASKEINLS